MNNSTAWVRDVHRNAAGVTHSRDPNCAIIVRGVCTALASDQKRFFMSVATASFSNSRSSAWSLRSGGHCTQGVLDTFHLENTGPSDRGTKAADPVKRSPLRTRRGSGAQEGETDSGRHCVLPATRKPVHPDVDALAAHQALCIRLREGWRR